MKKILSALFLSLCVATTAFAAEATLLSAVTSTGAGSSHNTYRQTNKTFHIVASSITSGGTVLIQSSNDDSNWATLSTTSVTADGTTEVALNGFTHKYIRANLSARTDGTYTVTYVGR